MVEEYEKRGAHSRESWEEIAALVTEVDGINRSGEQCRKRMDFELLKIQRAEVQGSGET